MIFPNDCRSGLMLERIVGSKLALGMVGWECCLLNNFSMPGVGKKGKGSLWFRYERGSEIEI